MAKVRLDDVAVEARETWNRGRKDVPVVGLEHLEPDEIWLRQWNVNPDENTFTKGFKKGQLLFGRRRAYQKKMSLAPCDGICSGDITVIAARPEKIVPELLPFYLRTDAFFDFAMRGSGGSLSPRVKWSHISDYEFDLPPMDEQKKLAELLWAANDLKESYKKAITATDEMLKAKFREMFDGAGDASPSDAEPQGESDSYQKNHASSKRVYIGEVADVFSGGTPSRDNPEYWKDGSIPWVKTTELRNSFINDTEEKITELGLENSSAKLMPVNTILVAMYGQGKTRGMTGCLSIPATTNQACACIVVHDCVDVRYLWMLLILSYQELRRMANSTSQANLSLDSIKHFQIPLPPLSLQREFVAIADKAESAKANLKKSIAAIDQVMKGLINHG